MKFLFFTVSEVKGGVTVIGNFNASMGDYVAFMGSAATGIHAWKDGKDACVELGCSHPITLMEGTQIPIATYSIGAYSIGPFPPSSGRLGGTNGIIRVGSTPMPVPPGKRAPPTRRRARSRG